MIWTNPWVPLIEQEESLNDYQNRVMPNLASSFTGLQTIIDELYAYDYAEFDNAVAQASDIMNATFANIDMAPESTTAVEFYNTFVVTILLMAYYIRDTILFSALGLGCADQFDALGFYYSYRIPTGYLSHN